MPDRGRRGHHCFRACLRAIACILASAPFAGPLPARADDLRDALAAAYDTNPALQAARAQLRATDEGVALARADGLPSLNATAQETEYLRQSEANPVTTPRLLAVTGTLNVPVYSGGAVRNAIKAADTRVMAGRANLAATESSVFAQVVSAYMDVIQNEAIVRLNRAQVETLRVTLRSTTDRFHVGEVTRTDVAQSQSRLALAEGNLRSAESNLVSVRETYIQVVGKAPADLREPPPLPGLPASAEEASAYALEHNPDLAAARESSRAARLDVRSAEASRLPRVGLFADTAYSDYLGGLAVSGFPATGIKQSFVTADVGVRATIPLYQGGKPTALVKQAEASESAALEQEIGTERSVIAQTRAAFSSWKAANDIIAATGTAVDAAQLSLRGVRAENGVGTRTILDILNAEQELVSAQVQLVTARRNAYVAGFSLLTAMGRAGARDLGLDGGALYDPQGHYRRMHRDLWDWGSDPRPRAQSTRTIDIPAPNGSFSGK